MDRAIREFAKHPMSGEELMKLAEGKIKIVTSNDICKFNSLNSLFSPYDAVIILYEKQRNNGHWVLLLNRPDVIEYFDPYGYKIDYPCELFNTPKCLSKLLFNSKLNKKIQYNASKLQKLDKDISSCGRWVALRYILRNIDLKSFINLFKNSKYPPDFYVTALTMFVN